MVNRSREKDSALTGWLSEKSPSELLQDVARHRTSGTLLLVTPKETVHLIFRDGRLRMAMSSAAEKHLGQHLIREGRITESALEKALQTQHKSMARLDEVLVGQGAISLATLLDEMRCLVLGIILPALAWREGTYEFYTETRGNISSNTLDLSTEGLIIEAIWRSADSVDSLKRLGDLSLAPIVAVQLTELTGFQFPPEVIHLHSQIDGERSIEALLDVGSGARSENARALYALLSSGVVTFSEENRVREPMTPRAPSISTRVDVMATSEMTEIERESVDFVVNMYHRLEWLSCYDILGVPVTASGEEIGFAYQLRRKFFHPDPLKLPYLASLNTELATLAAHVEAAHEILMDPGYRAAYDRKIREGKVLTQRAG